MLNKKGQNIAEYVILVAIIIGAAAAMQVYLKRGIQGRMADAVDVAPDVDVAGSTLTFSTKQYEPYYVNSASDVTSNSSIHETVGARSLIDRDTVQTDTTRAAHSVDETLGPTETSR